MHHTIMAHPIVGIPFETDNFNQPCGNPKGFLVGKIGSLRPSKVFTLKGSTAHSLWGPSNSHDAYFGLHIDLDQLEDEATP